MYELHFSEIGLWKKNMKKGAELSELGGNTRRLNLTSLIIHKTENIKRECVSTLRIVLNIIAEADNNFVK